MNNENLLMLYTSGKGYGEFLETNSGYYKEAILNFKNSVDFSDEFIEIIRAINEEKYFLAVAEPWCENSVINVTLLQVASEINEKIQYRIISQVVLGELLLTLKEDETNKSVNDLPIILELSSTGEIMSVFSEKPEILKKLESGSSVARVAMKKKYREGGLSTEIIREILKI